MKHLELSESKKVLLNPEFLEELSSVEDLLLVKGGGVPSVPNENCTCNGNCGC